MTKKSISFSSGVLSYESRTFYLETTMDIQLNGKRASVDNGTTVGDLIREKDLDLETVVVEHNREILTAEDLDRTPLLENDVLEILRFVGGG